MMACKPSHILFGGEMSEELMLIRNLVHQCQWDRGSSRK